MHAYLWVDTEQGEQVIEHRDDDDAAPNPQQTGEKTGNNPGKQKRDRQAQQPRQAVLREKIAQPHLH
jgi:hypothetical protein